MKIALVCQRYCPCIGGVETHVKEISERLAKWGNNVEVLTTDFPGKLKNVEEINGVTVRRFACWAPSESYYFSPRLRVYIKNHADDYDVIHSHTFNTLPALYVAWAKRRKAASVFTPHFHGGGHTLFRSLLYVPYSWIARQEFFKCDVVVCVSKYEKNLILSKYSIPVEKTVMIPNGIDFTHFKGISDKAEPISDSSKKVILYVGRLEKYKRVDVIIQALTNLEDNFRLEIVGKGPDKERLVNLVQKLQLISRVSFFENLSRKELVLKYAAASVFVMLSKKEAYGITVGEALLAGTPCVVADSGALSEWIDNQSSFDAINPEDPATVAAQIEKVAGRRVTSRPDILDWDEVAKRVLAVYERVA